MDTVSACYRAFFSLCVPCEVGDGGDENTWIRRAGLSPASPGAPAPAPKPTARLPGLRYAHHGRPRQRSTPGSPRELQPSSRSRDSGGSSPGTVREPRTHRARPGPAAPRRLRGAAPPAGACASPASCCAAAVPPRDRAASGPARGSAARVPPNAPHRPPELGTAGAEAAELACDGAEGERGAARPRLSVTVTGPRGRGFAPGAAWSWRDAAGAREERKWPWAARCGPAAAGERGRLRASLGAGRGVGVAVRVCVAGWALGKQRASFPRHRLLSGIAWASIPDGRRCTAAVPPEGLLEPGIMPRELLQLTEVADTGGAPRKGNLFTWGSRSGVCDFA